MIYEDHYSESSRQHLVTVAAYCRSCRESEIFDRYLVTSKHEITGEVETWTVKVCQGCGFEEPGRAQACEK